jgi:hypothetical protein
MNVEEFEVEAKSFARRYRDLAVALVLRSKGVDWQEILGSFALGKRRKLIRTIQNDTLTRETSWSKSIRLIQKVRTSYINSYLPGVYCH